MKKNAFVFFMTCDVGLLFIIETQGEQIKEKNYFKLFFLNKI